MENIKLLVAMHKAYCLPEDAVYAPIQVGGVHIPGMENALRDDTGENISNKNRSYCELTALYWGWKNLQADYLGLVHYPQAEERSQHHAGTGRGESLTASHQEPRSMLHWKKPL